MGHYILAFTLMHLTFTAFSQSRDTTTTPATVSGAVTLTNKGISLIPSFTLGKPAILFDVWVRKQRFSFELQLAFALNQAEPWYFVFWLRYKVVDKPTFRMSLGAHPSFAFSTNLLFNDPNQSIVVNRFFGGELAASYTVSTYGQIGLYYLHSQGVSGTPRSIRFLGINGLYSVRKPSRKLLLTMAPQLYYLHIDAKTGYYVTATFIFKRPRFPVSIASLVNKKIRSEIPSDDFLWNASLVYTY